MQRIRSIRRRTMVRLKTRLKTSDTDHGVGAATISMLLCVTSLFLLCDWKFDSTSGITCRSICDNHPDAKFQAVSISNSSSTLLNSSNLQEHCETVCTIQYAYKVVTDHDIHKDAKFQSQPYHSLDRILLCVAVLALFVYLNIKREMRKPVYLGSPQDATWQTALFRQLPLKTITMLVAKLFKHQFHWPLNVVSVTIFARVTKININEAEDPVLSNYKSISHLFVRKLQDGARPINSRFDVVSPADSRVIYAGGVSGNTLEQIKGVSYSLSGFIGRGVIPEACKEGHSLFTAVFYLAPGDYHHFHSPTDWNVDLCRHFKGDLLSVSPWFVRHIPGLFALNERVLLSGQWKHGFFSMTAVGALNVGSIHVNLCKDLATNQGDSSHTHYIDRRLSPRENALVKGQYIGGFSFGSTVVLLFEAPNDFKFVVEADSGINYGQPLGIHYS